MPAASKISVVAGCLRERIKEKDESPEEGFFGRKLEGASGCGYGLWARRAFD